MVPCADLSAWSSTCPPNTWGLPVSRLMPRNRLTSSRSSWNCCSRSERPRVTLRRSSELERTFHDRRMAREAAEERVGLALLELRGRKLHRRGLPATDELGESDYARVTFLQMLVGETRGETIAGHRSRVRGLGEHPVVP